MSEETNSPSDEEGTTAPQGDIQPKAAFAFDTENMPKPPPPPEVSEEEPELTELTLELGRWVKDRISGFEGVATILNLHLSGMVQVSVQPRVEKDKATLPDALSFDLQNVTYAEPPEGWVKPVLTPLTVDIHELEFELGHKVRDMVTKIEGIATQFAVMINGCLYVVIDPPMNEKQLLQKTHHFVDWQRVEYVGGGLKKKLEKKMDKIFEDNPEATRQPGGPVTKAFRP